MTPEQRLDRVERILGLFAGEGRRWRVRSREQDEKINILIQVHMETSGQIDKLTGDLNKLTDEVSTGHSIHNKEMAELRRSQKLTDRSLRTFIDSLRKGSNGTL